MNILPGISLQLRYRGILSFLFIIVCIFVSDAVLYSAPPRDLRSRVVLIDNNLTKLNIGESIEYMEDYSNLSVKDIDSSRYTGYFQTKHSSFPSFGYTRGAYWVRLRIRNTTRYPVNWYLECGYALMDEITFYSADRDGFHAVKTGDTFPFAQRPIRYRNFVFPIVSQPGENIYYLHIATRGSFVIPLSAWSPEHFHIMSEKENIRFGIFYGFMLAFMVYHLMIFTSIRQKSHLYLSILIGAMSLFSLVNSGLAFQYLWPSSPYWGNAAHPFLTLLGAMFTLTFSRSFLETRNRFPKMDRMILFIVILCLVLAGAVFLFDYYYMTQFAIIIAAITVIMTILVGIVSAFGRVYEARYFLAACLLYVSGILLMVIRSFGFIPDSATISYSYQFGMCLMMFILSIGVVDQIYKLKIEKQKAIDELKDSEKRYRSLVESAHDGIVLMKIDQPNFREGNVRYWVPYANPSFLRMLSCTPDEFYKANIADFLPETFKGKNVVRGHYLGRLRGDNQAATFEAELKDWNGNIVDAIVSSSIINIFNSKMLLAIVTDVTSLKKAEKTILNQYQEIHSQFEELEALNEELVQTQNELLNMNDRLANEKEQLAATLSSIGDAVITTDTEGCITMVNNAAEKLFGWKGCDVHGRAVTEMLRFIDSEAMKRANDTLFSILNRGGVAMTDAPMIAKGFDDVEHIVEMSGAAITIGGDRIIGAVLAIRDITERFKLQKELNKIGKLESLGMLAGGIAHDFNNLLTAIIGNLSLAREYAGENAECRDSIEMVESASQRAIALTRQLLTFSKGGEPVKQTASIIELLKESAGFLLSGSTVRPEFRFDKNVWAVDIDTDQISQVLHNIIINAVHAMPKGGVLTIEAHNVADPLPGKLPVGRYVELMIRDTGTGIPHRILSRIFDPYFTTKTDGNGLGLAICYSIINKHRGYIDVESEEGSGSVFRIYLRASEQTVAENDPSISDISRRSGRILVMDDERYIRDAVVKMLAYLGYDAIAASDGEEVLQFYTVALESDMPFDAVIMDLTVPGGMGGLETMNRLREIDPGITAIVSSGYSNDPVMANYSQYGFRGMIMKPYTMRDLMKALFDILPDHNKI